MSEDDNAVQKDIQKLNMEMNRFVGTAVVNATPMNRTDYNTLRGWKLPEDENGEDEGFLVERQDTGNPNVPGYSGYVSWSPAEVFVKAHNKSGEMTFGDAVTLAKLGFSVSRSGWNGKDMYAYIVPERTEDNLHIPYVKYREHWALKTAQGYVATWAPSGSDSLAEDWRIVHNGLHVTPKLEPTFVDRLEDEFTELRKTCNKLAKFITSDNLKKNCSTAQQKMLKAQLVHMTGYLKVLSERLLDLRSQ